LELEVVRQNTRIQNQTNQILHKKRQKTWTKKKPGKARVVTKHGWAEKSKLGNKEGKTKHPCGGWQLGMGAKRAEILTGTSKEKRKKKVAKITTSPGENSGPESRPLRVKKNKANQRTKPGLLDGFLREITP